MTDFLVKIAADKTNWYRMPEDGKSVLLILVAKYSVQIKN